MMFSVRMNMKSENTNGKSFMPSAAGGAAHGMWQRTHRQSRRPIGGGDGTRLRLGRAADQEDGESLATAATMKAAELVNDDLGIADLCDRKEVLTMWN